MKRIQSTTLLLILMVAAGLLSSCSVKPRGERENLDTEKVVIRFDEEEKEDDASVIEEIRPVDEPETAAPTDAEMENSLEKPDTDASAPPAMEIPSGAKAAEEVVYAPRLKSDPSLEYRLGQGDKLEVKFFKNPEYNETVSVRPDGKISLAYIGELDVLGMTPSDLEREITQAYSTYLIDPEITVILREFGGQFCYVMGEVEDPGQYPVTKGMTVLRAVATAGGAKRSGKMSSVILIRGDGNRSIEVTRMNLSMGNLEENLLDDLRLKPYDLVFIPRTFISNLDAFVRRIYDYVIPPTDLFYRYKYWYRNE